MDSEEGSVYTSARGAEGASRTHLGAGSSSESLHAEASAERMLEKYGSAASSSAGASASRILERRLADRSLRKVKDERSVSSFLPMPMHSNAKYGSVSSGRTFEKYASVSSLPGPGHDTASPVSGLGSGSDVLTTDGMAQRPSPTLASHGDPVINSVESEFGRCACEAV